MKKLTAYVFIALLSFSAFASESKPELDFGLNDFSGKEHKLSEYIGNGKWTIVVIWAEDCEVCNTEAENIDSFHKQYKDKNASILGVSIDGKEKVELAKDFVKRHKLTFPNLIIEPDMEYIGKFGGGDLLGTPTFYIYTPEGEIVAAQAGGVPMNIIEDFIANYKKQ